MPWREWLERGIGASFCFAGVAKFLPFADNPQATLAQMAAANQGTELAAISHMLAENGQWMGYFVGLVMIASGLTQVFQLGLRQFATIGQVAMIIGFITLLHRAFPSIFLDALYLLGFALIWFTTPNRETTRHA